MPSLCRKLVDIACRTIRPVELTWEDGLIQSIGPSSESPGEGFLLPGFVDSHIHIESSMLVPSQFAKVAVGHGTVATVSDPHEIANVLGQRGIEYMIDDGKRVPLKFFFGAPSCVPATPFETAGAALNADDIAGLLDHADIHYLAEMMNYPGVIGGDPQVHQKIQAAKNARMRIDGHAPGVRGADAVAYFRSGISTDHECTTLEEAIEKLDLGVMIQIREGSAARNFDALHSLLRTHAERLMFCSDDKHPDDLLVDHIDGLCRRALHEGHDLFDILHAACVAPVQHYDLNVGQLRVGDPADFIEVASLEELRVARTWIEGECVFMEGEAQFAVENAEAINHFDCRLITDDALSVANEPGKRIRVIEVEDGQIVTGQSMDEPRVEAGQVVADKTRDLLKLVNFNRYHEAPPAIGFVRGFGLQQGAIAGSVGHDSHNILAVGTDDACIVQAINGVIEAQGGLTCCDGQRLECLPLPVAGLMSLDSCQVVGQRYQQLDAMAKKLGCVLQAPYMTLSFLGLLVIPSLKLSDHGLFDGEAFQPVDLHV
ncbi:MAG: adenine deaminase [Planctomycetota bacterium]